MIIRFRIHQIPVMLMFGWTLWIQASKSDLVDLKRPLETDWEQVGERGAYTALEDCEKGLARQADTFQFYLTRRDPDAKRHDKIFLSHDATSLYSHEFFCLLDTVDPRGPKGK